MIKPLKEAKKLVTQNSELWLPLREQEKFRIREECTGDNGNVAFFKLGYRYTYVLYIIIP